MPCVVTQATHTNTRTHVLSTPACPSLLRQPQCKVNPPGGQPCCDCGRPSLVCAHTPEADSPGRVICFLRLSPGSRIRSDCSPSEVFHGCLECPAEPQLGSWGTSVQGPAWRGVACWRAWPGQARPEPRPRRAYRRGTVPSFIQGGPGSLPTIPGPACL